ncbi:uncharacterized protein LOC100267181 [Vitis vinifera]|nr:uncharacterized protein LOC100267181 [Vitis vinifera]
MHPSMAASSALLKLPFLCSSSSSSSSFPHISPYTSSPFSPFPNPKTQPNLLKHTSTFHLLPISYRFSAVEDENEDECNFDDAVALFNSRDYYRCHDFLEEIWNRAEDPVRTLVHGILQCAVGLHHLFNQNHRGAMMELGEGLCKLRKMNFETGPFLQFEQEISAVLEFIYQTQLELAACTDDFCIAMDQSERSYQLLGGYGAGQRLYHLEGDPNEIVYIVFSPERSQGTGETPRRVKLPILNATEEYLMASGYN